MTAALGTTARATGVVVLGLALGAIATYDSRTAAIAGCFVALLALLWLTAEATIVLALAAFAAPLVWVMPPSVGDTRLLVPLLLVPLAIKALSLGTPLIIDEVVLGITALGVVALLSLFWSRAAGESLGTASALLTIAALLTLAGNQIKQERLTWVIRFVGATVIASGWLLAAVPAGQLAGRLRGVFQNPNSLAVLLVLTMPFLFTGAWKVFGLAALPLVMLSGSRAGTAACLVQIAILLAVRAERSTARRLLVACVAGAAIWLGISALNTASTMGTSSAGSGSSVLRLNDSRTLQWQEALEVWREASLSGIGAGASQIDAGSSYLRLLMELGLIGVIAAVPLMRSLLRSFIRHSPQVAALAAGAAVSGIFEGWMFTAGSLFFLLLWLPIRYGRTVAHDAPTGGLPNAPAHANARST